MQTILGAGGAIGVLLAQHLPAYTDRVRLVSRNPKRINPTDELFSADLVSGKGVDEAVAGSEIVYLTVGLPYDSKIWTRDWPRVMQHVIAACKKHKAKLVFFDNVYLYHPSEIPHMTEAARIEPMTQKGKVRARIAKMLTDEFGKDELDCLIARSADFYGPNAATGILNVTLIDPLKAGETGNWLVDTDKPHNMTYTPDAARATALLGNTPSAYNQVWHLPTQNETLTGNEWARLIADKLGTAPKIREVKPWMIKLFGLFDSTMRAIYEMRYQYDRPYLFDSGKFDAAFPEFEKTPTDRAISETLAATT